MGPSLGLDAQTLGVEISGGVPPYDVIVCVTSPSGATTDYFLVANDAAFSFDSGDAEDIYFGVSEEGTWEAQAVVDAIPSNIAFWEVEWYPIHVVR